MEKVFNLTSLGQLHQCIHALKDRADAGKRITPKDINELVALMDQVKPELHQRCNPVDPKEYGG